MNDQPTREEVIFTAALALKSPAERAALLDRECAGDAGLRRAVEELLSSIDEVDERFLATPPGAAPAATPAAPGATIHLPRAPGGTIVLGGAIPAPSGVPVKLPEDEYQVGGEIARGGMGSILEAEDRKLGRKVAMKVMKLEVSASEYARTRFVREATVLARLEHPNIVPIHQLGWDEENRLFYTMKLVQGRTLQAVLNGLKAGEPDFINHYTLDRLLTIFRKICDALSLAHSHGVIHRDLKPENVMVGEFGEVLVMDWGIAKILGDTSQAAAESAQRAEATAPGTAERFRELADAGLKNTAPGLTMDGTVMGTPHYMSPEQADGRVTEIDQQSDVFSLGAILYAILTLRPPVEADSPYDIIEKIKRGAIQPPTIYNATTTTSGRNRSHVGPAASPARFQPLPHCPNGKVPTALSAVAMKALTVDKAKRYATVADLAADVENYQGGFATSAEEAGLFTQLRLLIQRNQREFAVGGAAALLLVVATVWFVINLRAKERRAVAGEEKAVAEAERATQAEKVAVEKGEAARRALAKAQVALADSAFRNADLAGMVRALEATPEDLRDQTWSYLSAKRDASQRPVEFSAVKNPTDVLALPTQPGHFVVAGKATTVAIVDVAGGDRVTQTFDTDMNGAKAMAISGDGTVLAVVGRKNKNRGGTVRLFDVATGALRKELTPPLDAGALSLNRDGSRLAVAQTGAGARDGCAVLDTAEGKTLWRFQDRIIHVDFTPDGERLVASSLGSRRHLKVFRAADGAELGHLDAGVSSQAISADGKYIAVGSPEGDCFVLDGTNGAVLTKGHPFTGTIYALAFTPDGHLLASGDEGKFGDNRWVLRLLDPGKLSPVGTFFGLQPGEPAPWSLHPLSGELLTADNPLRLWQISVGRELVKLQHHGQQAWGGCFLTDTLLLGRKNFGLQLYDLTTPSRPVEVTEWSHYRTVASHWPSGRFILGGPSTQLRREAGNLLKLYAVENAAPVLKHDLTFITRLPRPAFDGPGEHVAVVGEDSPVEVFAVQSGESVLRVPGLFYRVAFAGGGRNLVALGRRGANEGQAGDVLLALDGVTGAARRTVNLPFRANALAVSPDGRWIAIGGSDQMVHLFAVATLTEQTAFRAHEGELTALEFHPRLPVIATAAMDRSVKLWEHGTARMLGQFLGLGGTPVVLAFNPSGNLLLVDGQEPTSHLFDVSPVLQAAAR